MQYCPCGSKKNYIDCCGIFIKGDKNPETPEELMRSRYTAYTLVNMDYILNTMTGAALDNFDIDSARTWATNSEWLGLDVIEASGDHTKGYVKFVARFKENGKLASMSETSEFHKIKGKWYYVDGIVSEPKPYSKSQIGRNELCSCGSGKKYKKCCLI